DSFDAVQSNRAASRKFLSQLLQTSRGLSVPVDLQPSMLHRSPSGAKRKIRQQREKDVSIPPSRPSVSSSSSSPPSSSSPSQSMAHSMPPENYRRLIDDGGYQSILPDLNSSFSQPVPAPRMSVPFSSSMVHLDRIGSPSIRLESSFSSSPSPSIDRCSPSIDTPTVSTPPTVPPPSKPTVEVHPMPSERKKDKPAVPAKPKGLRLMDPLTPTSLSPSPVMNRWNSTNSVYTPPLSASPLSTSSLFINQLFSTPSFANLTASYDKSDELDLQEKQDLENRRTETVYSLETRIRRSQEELANLQREMVMNDEIGMSVLQIIGHADGQLYNKVLSALDSEKELLSLETNLKLQLEKCRKHLRDDLTTKKSETEAEEIRVMGKLTETKMLRKMYDKREKNVERALEDLLREEDMKAWRTYKEDFCKMIEESRQLEMAINDAKMQLRVLGGTRTIKS
ncbi:hypothetical protein PFISCL1PPCAC_10259, partial [Pristionchus fissidentatus]